MHLPHWKFFLYDIVLQIKDKISQNLAKFLFIKSFGVPVI